MAELEEKKTVAPESVFDIPPLNFFTEGNIYSGSAHSFFRYRIAPGESFTCTVWHDCNAYDSIADDVYTVSGEFGMSDGGKEQMLEWLEKRYAEFRRDHPEHLVDKHVYEE